MPADDREYGPAPTNILTDKATLDENQSLRTRRAVVRADLLPGTATNPRGADASAHARRQRRLLSTGVAAPAPRARQHASRRGAAATDDARGEDRADDAARNRDGHDGERPVDTHRPGEARKGRGEV